MKLTKFMPLAGLLLHLLLGLPSFAEDNKSCDSAKNDFKKLYMAIQTELKNPSPPKDPESKLFEDALFQEYQNSLTKVAKVYQISKQEKPGKLTQNSTLVDFFKALDEDTNLEGTFDKLLEELKKSSVSTNTADTDKQFIINDNDIYLLKQLLNHAHDKNCKEEKPEKIKKDTPLNRMLYALQKNSVKTKPDLKMVDTKNAIDSAVAKQMITLRDWMKKQKTENPICFKIIESDLDFTAKGIQACNYKKFIDSLIIENSNVSNLESILHFIYANQKDNHLNFEAFINQAFNNILEGKVKPLCSDDSSAAKVEEKVEKSVVNKALQECQTKIKADVTETGFPRNNWSWNSDKEKCVPKENKKDESEEDDIPLPATPDTKEPAVYPNKPVPASFVPAQIPREQPGFTPGMK